MMSRQKPFKRVEIFLCEGDDEMSFTMPMEWEDTEDRKDVMRQMVNDMLMWYGDAGE